ncbi:MAG TPA: M15 family metallopeptidase [Kofleriaceae bacterium]|nr:M15 family metallopeptidase [Kofleriaceae bacterium]
MSFRAEVQPIPSALVAEMTGASWHPDPRCPAWHQLVLVRMSHWGFDGALHDGELVVAAAVADDVMRAFSRVFDARFPIQSMVRIDAHGGDDDRSMAANNCSGFNFRTVAGLDALSLHSFGTAIDINPVQNPYIAGERVLPPAATAYLDRDDVRPGMIVRPGPVTDAFDEIGWEWGGDWSPRKDYHHFAVRRAAP